MCEGRGLATNVLVVFDAQGRVQRTREVPTQAPPPALDDTRTDAAALAVDGDRTDVLHEHEHEDGADHDHSVPTGARVPARPHDAELAAAGAVAASQQASSDRGPGLLAVGLVLAPLGLTTRASRAGRRST